MSQQEQSAAVEFECILNEHRYQVGLWDDPPSCSCGDWEPKESVFDASQAEFRKHQAQALLAARTKWLPQVLGELAEDEALLWKVRRSANVAPRASVQWLEHLAAALVGDSSAIPDGSPSDAGSTAGEGATDE